MQFEHIVNTASTVVSDSASECTASAVDPKDKVNSYRCVYQSDFDAFFASEPAYKRAVANAHKRARLDHAAFDVKRRKFQHSGRPPE